MLVIGGLDAPRAAPRAAAAAARPSPTARRGHARDRDRRRRRSTATRRAEAWLAGAVAEPGAIVDEALAVLNRAVHAHRVAAADP